MDEEAKNLSPLKYYEEAKEMLEKKDLVNFILDIGRAEILAGNENDLLAKITFLKVKGFVNFKQYNKAIESIEEALKYNDGVEAFRLKKYKGISLGYAGDLHQSIRIFKELLNETDDSNLLVEAYINLAWANLALHTEENNEENLEEVKIYLDLIFKNFDSLNRIKKMQYYNNYSKYYSNKGDYEKAIEMQEQALDYCEEWNLPEIYNNLAAYCLESDKDGIPVCVTKYTEQAEVIGAKYNNKFEMAKSFYNVAMLELRKEAYLRAIDSLYLAFNYFKDVEAYPFAFDSLIKINEIINDCKIDCMKSMKESMKVKLKGTPYYEKI